MKYLFEAFYTEYGMIGNRAYFVEIEHNEIAKYVLDFSSRGVGFFCKVTQVR